MPHDQTPGAIWRIYWLIVALLLLTLSGHFYTPDEEAMYLVSKAIVDRGAVDIGAYTDYQTSIRVPGIDGKGYASYGLLPSLLAAPLYAVATFVTPQNPLAQYDLAHVLISAVNIPFTAAIAVIIALLLQKHQVSYRVRLFVAISTVFGFLLPYSRSFLSEILATFSLLLCTYAFICAQENAPHTHARRWWFALSGTALGLLVNTRVVSVVVVPVFLLACLIWHPRRAVWQDIAAWVGGGLPWLLLFVWYNMVRFGLPFAAGYGNQHTNALNNPIVDGAFGLLLSLKRGLIWYAPFIWLLPVGAWVMYHQRQLRLLFLYGALFLVHLIMYSRVWFWDGGGVWGPRYLVITIPYLYLITAQLWHLRHRWIHWVAGGLLIATIAISVLGAAVNFATYTNLSNPHPSPIVAHAQLLNQRFMAALPIPQRCFLHTGWYEREQADQALFRRSEAQSSITCILDRPTVIELTLDDRRPDTAPPSRATLSVDTYRYTMPTGQIRTIHWLPFQRYTTIKLDSETWNPREIGFGNRNQDLGPTLLFLTGSTHIITVSDTNRLSMPELYSLRWVWYYDPINQHLLDWWPLYLPYTALSPYARPLMTIWVCAIMACVGVASLHPIRAWLRHTQTPGAPPAPGESTE
jgi:4-amino-4-deoxy-L-arabinose transferase-like glycosyltransferase